MVTTTWQGYQTKELWDLHVKFLMWKRIDTDQKEKKDSTIKETNGQLQEMHHFNKAHKSGSNC